MPVALSGPAAIYVGGKKLRRKGRLSRHKKRAAKAAKEIRRIADDIIGQDPTIIDGEILRMWSEDLASVGSKLAGGG